MSDFLALLAAVLAVIFLGAVLAWHGNLRLTLAARPAPKTTVTGEKP
jgi:hypothetical protein